MKSSTKRFSRKIPTMVIFGRLNHDQIYIEREEDGDYWINEDFGGPAAYAGIAAAAQGERVGLVSFAGDEFLEESTYEDIADNDNIDISGVKFYYEKMPLLRVWYPNNEKKLTIGMIWDENPSIEFDMIPSIYLKSKAFLYMPMIDEIPVDLIEKVAKEAPDSVRFIDVQGAVRHLKDPKDTTSEDWEGMPPDQVEEWTNMPNPRRVIYERAYDLEKILANVSIIKVNEGELGILADVDLLSFATESDEFKENMLKGVKVLAEKALSVGNPEIIITVTLGSYGAYTSYVEDTGKRTGTMVGAVLARKDEINPTGAGDTYSSAFLIAYKKRADPILATKYALTASSLGVEKDGPRDRPQKEDVYHRMIEYYGIR